MLKFNKLNWRMKKFSTIFWNDIFPVAGFTAMHHPNTDPDFIVVVLIICFRVIQDQVIKERGQGEKLQCSG